MDGENITKRGQLRGYLFEIAILVLLEKNGFTRINPKRLKERKLRENRQGFIEFEGRGCWHQIDCPCDYDQVIPFMYPIRLLGEVKFLKGEVQKEHIREYIGVLKDIQENYFTSNTRRNSRPTPRKMEIGVFFSANGFQAYAENLAFAHGIKTISYKNHYLVNQIKLSIERIEAECLSVDILERDSLKKFRQEFTKALRQDQPVYSLNFSMLQDDSRFLFENVVNYELLPSLQRIQTSIIGSTATGVFLHIISLDSFPVELFEKTDIAQCQVFYRTDIYNQNIFYLSFTRDPEQRKFYFTPPESLDRSTVYGQERTLIEKDRHFRKINISTQINGIMRNLIIELDTDWFNAIEIENNVNIIIDT